MCYYTLKNISFLLLKLVKNKYASFFWTSFIIALYFRSNSVLLTLYMLIPKIPMLL